MARPKGGLGRGLGSLIPAEAPTSGDGLQELAISSIQANQYQPRQQFAEEDLVSLTASIAELGVLQPILVRRTGENAYELIAGERRLRAAKRAGLDHVPAVVRDVSDRLSLEQALVENLHRADLNAIEEAAAYQQLIDDFSLTQEQVATRVGRSRSAVANALRLFQLEPALQAMIVDGRLTAGHGRALLGAGADRVALAERVVAESMSVRALEDYVKASLTDGDGGPPEPPSPQSDEVPGPTPTIGDTRPAALLELEELLAERLETRVSVQLGSARGKVTIDFADIDDLERIYRLMMGT